jgi:hypothetical protein
MRDRGSNAWVWATIAFVVGLAIGLGLFAWQFTTTERTIAVAKQRLESQNTSLTAENQRLSSELRTIEASLAAVAAKEEAARAAAEQAASPGGGSSSETTVTGPLEWVERSVSPNPVEGGGKLELVVKIKGGATKVTMRVVARKTGGSDKTHFLAKTDETDGVQTWKRVISVPTAPGEYRYYATAYQGDAKYVMPGVSAFSFMIE